MNELLLWMSAVGSGTEASLKRKAAELLLPSRRGPPSAYSRAIWNLSSLAHCEFGGAAGGGWRVAPPVLAAGDPAVVSSAILCGARSMPLLRRLAAAAGGRMTVTARPDAPDVVRVAASSASALLDLGREAAVPVQWNAPLAVLAAFAPPSLADCGETAMPSGGWAVERFSKSKMTWVASTVAEAVRTRQGLFRFRSDYDTRHVFRQGSVTRVVPPGIAKYWALGRRQRAMRLDLERGIVSFPPTARPPGLVDRALVVASGQLPVLSDMRVTYSGVTAPLAAAVSAALRGIALGAES